MAPSDDSRWKSAVDPRSGRTYYYHEETRETQWRKPMELASSDERRAMEQKEQRQKDFFAAMEANILNSMSQGVVPGTVRRTISRKSSKIKGANGVVEEVVEEVEEEEEVSGLIRTISTMDETILRDVCRRQPSFRSMSFSKKNSLEPGELGMEGAEMGNNSFATLSKIPLDPLEESIRETDNNSLNDMFSNLPLENPGASDSERDGSESRMNESSISGFGLTWEETQALKKLAEITKEMAESEDKDIDIVRVPPKGSTGAKGSASWKPRESKSKDLPRELDFDDSSESGDEKGSTTKKSSKFDHSKLDKPSALLSTQAGPPRALPREMDFDDSDEDSDFEPTPLTDKKQSIRIVEEKNTVVEVEPMMERPAVTRRNTCGTLYVGSTMSAPDKDATIKCICGVYRAHILSVEKDPVSRIGSEKYNVFNDQESEQGRNARAMKSRTPSLEEVSTFYRDIFFKAQMESDCIIMSLIYVERLIKRTNGELRPRASNWRSLLFSCMILSSKVWDDLSMWNADFSQSCPPGVSFPLQRINELELSILNALSFQVKVLASEYAKYYFLLRSMLIKSGLGGDGIQSMNPLDVLGAQRLQQVSTQYETRSKTKSTATIEFTNRSKSLTAAEQMKVAANTPGKVGLEHVVKM